MISEIKLYISNTNCPYTNLAIEKYLLDSVEDNCCILYLWQNDNTVVIGKNQNPWTECNVSALKSKKIKLARRLSGGGAVFHDLGNLNFTFICSTENYNLSKQMKVIQKACELSGITTEISGRNDILASGFKFSGNAFYNSKGKSYHHGTILINSDKETVSEILTPSKAKLEAKGVKSVKSRIINLSEINPELTCEIMKSNLLYAFEAIYNSKAKPITELNAQTIVNYSELFGSDEFLYGSTLPFTCECKQRFSWGEIQLQLLVKSGIIVDVMVYTDAMDHELSDILKSALINLNYDKSDMIRSISERFDYEISKDISTLISEWIF